MFFRDDAVRVAALSEYVDRQARDQSGSPDVWFSKVLTVIFYASGGKCGKNFASGSSYLSCPRSARSMTAMAVNCFVTEPRDIGPETTPKAEAQHLQRMGKFDSVDGVP